MGSLSFLRGAIGWHRYLPLRDLIAQVWRHTLLPLIIWHAVVTKDHLLSDPSYRIASAFLASCIY